MVKKASQSSSLAELGKTAWMSAEEAIRAGNVAEALKYVKEAQGESEKNNDTMTSFVEQVLTHLAGIREEEVEKIIRSRYYQPVVDFIASTHTVEESLRKCIQSQRRHQAQFALAEEQDRYVVRYDPCGTGARLRRARNVGVTKKAYPWSWGKAGIPYYCSHCCIHFEILPIELQGYPVRITLMGERPEDPCVHLFYKKPELIPEEYFTRVGKTKTIK